MTKIKAYGTHAKDKPLKPITIERRALQPDDVEIKILFCGVCHSDIHATYNDWGRTNYPLVPGHEIVGRVTQAGKAVSRFKKDEIVGVGVMVDSCQKCTACLNKNEQYCENGFIGTYNAPDKISGGFTFGGYSQTIVTNENFVLKIPSNLDPAKAGPLLCAGITTYSPLKHWHVKKGDKVGIIGLGGLGHLGIKFAKAMGAHVVMITTSKNKGEDAKLLGADEVLISTDIKAMDKAYNSFDFLLNTIPVGHNVNPYLELLKADKTMVLVGSLEPLTSVDGGLLIRQRKHLAGSLIGGVSETEAMLEFCSQHQIYPEIEMITMSDINTAFTRIIEKDVKYRFVIDMASLT